MYVMFPTGYFGAVASTSKSLAPINKSQAVGEATKERSALWGVAGRVRAEFYVRSALPTCPGHHNGWGLIPS